MTYNPEISFGTILTILTMLASIVAFFYKHGIDMALLKKGQEDSKKEVSGIKFDVATLSGKVEGLAVIQARLADGKERMDDFEVRLRACEVHK